jgi:hypothetical protein
MNTLLAQNNTNTPKAPTNNLVVPGKIKSPVGSGSLTGAVNGVINLLFALIVIAAVVVIIIAGFRMVIGGGNPDQIAKAKKTIIWAILGLVVAFMSFAIVRIIQGLL